MMCSIFPEVAAGKGGKRIAPPWEAANTAQPWDIASRSPVEAFTPTIPGSPDVVGVVATSPKGGSFHGLDSPRRMDTLLISIVELREHIDERFASNQMQLDRMAREQRIRQDQVLEKITSLSLPQVKVPVATKQSNGVGLTALETESRIALPSAAAYVQQQPKPVVDADRGSDDEGMLDASRVAFSSASGMECSNGGRHLQGRDHASEDKSIESSKLYATEETHEVVANGKEELEGTSGNGTTVIQAEEEEEEAPRLTHCSTYKPRGRSKNKHNIGDEIDSNDSDIWHDGETKWQEYSRRYNRFIRSSTFDHMMGVVILLNTFFLGLQVDQKAQVLASSEEDDLLWIKVTESVFAAVFFFELVARLFAYTKRFCCEIWNVFDSFIVFTALIEECLKYGVGGSTVASKFSVLRMMRVLKLVRALRIIRVLRAFHELRMVMTSIIQCLVSVLWTLLIMFLLIYVFAILILVELTNSNKAFEDTPKGTLRKLYFHGLARAIYTLYQATTGGIAWEEASSALEEVTPWIPALWVVYITFVVFAITNSITGIFVEQTFKSSLQDETEMRHQDVDLRERMHAKMKELFEIADEKKTGLLKRNMVETVCRQVNSLKEFKGFGCCEAEWCHLFDLVADENKYGEMFLPLEYVDFFARDVLRVKGQARNIDVVALAYKQRDYQMRPMDRNSHSNLCRQTNAKSKIKESAR